MADTYGGKMVLDVNGQPGFAEIAILAEFRREGWEGVWIDTYRGKFRVDWHAQPIDQLPAVPAHALDRIVEARAGVRRGTWDVLCWKGPDLVFAESKRSQRDQIRPDQTGFLETALAVGVPLDSFLVVEWRVTDRGRSG